ncbi:SHOCT domain-containing protein [Nitrosopumilus sp.]|uniref:SHOCT domain-containing protein n=1 Tax=Nitrosopumilus sp. TaxID=2024843 RepID=UPI00247C09ED|nr:SHOCT domain-containing protein [Nitrosopumilus sp.]MCV0409833.1 SHOCT domain-containing protein [Nitrosopumilus sp.]
MVTENKKSESSDTMIKKKQEKIMSTIEHTKNLGKESLGKISEVGSTGTAFLKSKPYWGSLKNSSQKIKEKTLEHGAEFKKNSPKFYKKISSGFFYFFESIIGRIKLGTQYGTPSLEILERLAKLKELGILTEEEFTNKKKKILDRI